MTTLSEIKTRVRDALGKGTSMDSSITSALRAAARKIEQQRTYQYMKKYGTVSFDLESDFPYIIDTPRHFKRIRLIRLNVDGQFYRIKRGLIDEQLSLVSGQPSRYELDGTSRLVFDAIPDEAYDLHIFFDEYTSWPTEDSATNWLIDNGEEVLYWEALFNLTGPTRDARWRVNAEKMKDEAYRALLIADEEMADSDFESKMLFTPEGGLDRDDA